MTTPTQQLSDAGVSIWLDDLSRDRIQSGSLQALIESRNVVGVTTNPTIFAAAIATGATYAEQIREVAAAGGSVTDAVFAATTDDVAAACDIFRGVYDRTNGQDGRVSIEVEPHLAFDAETTIAQAKELFATVNRENVMIKIPATKEGLTAITAVIGAGISVNVTLIFSIERHAEVIDAYLAGLEIADAAGIDLSTIRSVASFFVSRVDTEIDKRLLAIGTDEARALTGKAAVANARLAYELFEQKFASERAAALLAKGAHTQRPLWASTGVKDPSLPDTMYVTELAVADTVNTMPEKTLEATFDHADVRADAVHGTYDEARALIASIEALGVSIADVTDLLEREGVDKFIVSWNELLDIVTATMEGAR
ncbi:transaldolase [Microbacteriaceae bacterium MWH-Ta3]|nr:transaldolase [Microbacteriaceae bacterium MWH-Ta3]